MFPVIVCKHSFIIAVVTWCLLLSLALSEEGCRTPFFTNKSAKRSEVIKGNGRRCCHDCLSTTSTLLRGGGSNDELINNRKRIISSRSSSSSNTSTQRMASLPQLLSSTHGRRSACSFYIWNAPSALLHRWCHHLQRDNIYEGLGGKKVSCYSDVGFLKCSKN